MTGEINSILEEIVKACAKNGIKVAFTQYGSKKNSVEETIEMGNRVVQIQLGNKDDDGLRKLLSDFLKGIKG
jgi:hypothetical protein